MDTREDLTDPLLAWPLECPSDIFPSTRVPTKSQLRKRFPQTALIVHPRNWINGLNLTWARSNLGSLLTCMVGLSFLLWMILDRDSMRSLFSLSPLNFFLTFSNPIFSPNFSYL